MFSRRGPSPHAGWWEFLAWLLLLVQQYLCCSLVWWDWYYSDKLLICSSAPDWAGLIFSLICCQPGQREGGGRGERGDLGGEIINNYHQKIVFSATSWWLGPARLRGSNFSCFFVGGVSYLGCWLRLWLWWAERELNKSFSPTKTERSLTEPETNQVFLCIGIQNLLAYAVLQVNPYHWRSLIQFLVVFFSRKEPV